MNLRQTEELTGWAFALPFLVSLGAFFLYAALRTFYFSFTDFDLFSMPAFVGLANYLALVTDNLFLIALGNTLSFSLIVTVSQTTLAMLLAVLVNRSIAGRGVWRTIFYLPSIMSSAAMTIIFLWLFQRQGLMTGLVQFAAGTRWYILSFFAVWVLGQLALVFNARRKYEHVGLGDPFFLALSLAGAVLVTFLLRLGSVLPLYGDEYLISWLNTSTRFLFMPQTLWSIALMNVFTTVPTFMLMFLAGLQTVPVWLYEAAELDGASGFQKFRDITVPALAPVTFAVVTFGIIGTLQMFDQVAILGTAAPIESRVTLAYYIYDNAFPQGATPRIGMSSAAAVLLGIITIAVVYIQRALGVSDRTK
ncbi:MAG: sugar ABC transporter permease [Devosia sp.]|nr:sugar ABC transporter permease [Devosia sp.]